MDHLSLAELREQFAKEFPPQQESTRDSRRSSDSHRLTAELLRKLEQSTSRHRRRQSQPIIAKILTKKRSTTFNVPTRQPKGPPADDPATADKDNPGKATSKGFNQANRPPKLSANKVEDEEILADNFIYPAINTALGLNVDGTGIMSLNATNGSYPSYLEGPSANQNVGASGGMQRQAPSPLSQQQGNNNGPNGVGGLLNGMGMGMPVNAGQQMDLNLVFQKVNELSELLKENRERTQGIVAGAEELATRAAANGASPSLQEANHEVSAARIADLTRQVNQLQHVKQTLLREQRENTKLIGEYETSLGNIVEQIRNFSYGKNMEKAQLSRDYNKLLQDEKDAHLATRLEKDDWHAKFMRSVEMIREAYRLRCEEEEMPIRVVAGLQNEVRAYRNALGMEPEKFEDEFGYEILKDVKGGAGDV